MSVMKIYRMRDVCETTGLKPSTIYKLVRTKDFPAPVKLTSRSSGWTSGSVDEWVASRLAYQLATPTVKGG